MIFHKLTWYKQRRTVGAVSIPRDYTARERATDSAATERPNASYFLNLHQTGLSTHAHA